MISNVSLSVVRGFNVIYQGRKSILRIEISKNNPFRRRAAADEPY